MLILFQLCGFVLKIRLTLHELKIILVLLKLRSNLCNPHLNFNLLLRFNCLTFLVDFWLVFSSVVTGRLLSTLFLRLYSFSLRPNKNSNLQQHVMLLFHKVTKQELANLILNLIIGYRADQDCLIVPKYRYNHLHLLTLKF